MSVKKRRTKILIGVAAVLTAAFVFAGWQLSEIALDMRLGFCATYHPEDAECQTLMMEHGPPVRVYPPFDHINESPEEL